MVRIHTAHRIVIVCLLVACRTKQDASDYDGKWWVSLQQQDQAGFVSGYLDCYIWAAHEKQYSDASINQQIAALDKYYSAYPSKSRVAVSDVLGSMANQHERQVTGELHGTYDGDYWRQSRARIFFVRGYLECEHRLLPNTFSKSPEDYASAISRWYGVSETDESELNDKTANDKIGDVLLRLRDRGRPIRGAK